MKSCKDRFDRGCLEFTENQNIRKLEKLLTRVILLDTVPYVYRTLRGEQGGGGGRGVPGNAETMLAMPLICPGGDIVLYPDTVRITLLPIMLVGRYNICSRGGCNQIEACPG